MLSVIRDDLMATYPTLVSTMRGLDAADITAAHNALVKDPAAGQQWKIGDLQHGTRGPSFTLHPNVQKSTTSISLEKWAAQHSSLDDDDEVTPQSLSYDDWLAEVASLYRRKVRIGGKMVKASSRNLEKCLGDEPHDSYDSGLSPGEYVAELYDQYEVISDE